MQVDNWCQLPGVYKVFAVNADGRDKQRVTIGETSGEGCWGIL